MPNREGLSLSPKSVGPTARDYANSTFRDLRVLSDSDASRALLPRIALTRVSGYIYTIFVAVATASEGSLSRVFGRAPALYPAGRCQRVLNRFSRSYRRGINFRRISSNATWEEMPKSGRKNGDRVFSE